MRSSNRSRRVVFASETATECRTQIIDHPVLVGRDKVVFGLIAVAWLAASIVFWRWWIQSDHVLSLPTFIVATFALAYDLLMMPAVFIFMMFKMRRPEPISPPDGLRVAMVTAIVPSSESIDVLERTLAAMVRVRYPHDNWVLDEGGDPQVRALCARYGANYWTRKGVPEFNQPEWPFQAKTKSGNYNSWFSQIAYERYDYLVQLDTDHAPVEEYLDEVLGYFIDPEVAYVALPSVYWNLDDWPSRGSSEQSQIFQGPIQMGYYGWARTPMIIGSHAAYRMSALQEIGGFAPSRAEDHLDSLRFAQLGYRGVFVSKVLATGLGPHTLSDYLVQEHQWAFSIMQVLLKYAGESGRLGWRQRIAFLFSECWYSLFAFCYLILFSLPIFALLTNRPIVNLSFLQFMLHSLPITLTALVGVAWGYRKGWYRPGNHFFMSWQGIILAAARWPIVLIALVNAVISIVFRNGAFTYMVTPKGRRAVQAKDTLRVIVPFVVLAVVPIATVIAYPFLGRGTSFDAAGYVAFALLSSILYTSLVVAAFFDHIRSNLRARVGFRRALGGAVPIAVIAVLLLQGIVVGGSINRVNALEALRYDPNVEHPSSRPNVAELADDGESVEALVPQPTSTPLPTPTAVPTATPTVVPTATPAPRLVSSPLFKPAASGVTFGAYDPDGNLARISRLDHLFTRWMDDDSGGVPLEDIQRSYDRGVPVMLSLEPWPIAGVGGDDLADAVVQGEYDAIIRRAAVAARSVDQPILIRFGHEMDLADLYPWSNADADKYIAMYRHTVRLFRAAGATNVLWVWSPAGTEDALRYYPGDAWVDYVGLTVLEYSGWETAAGHAEPRDYKDLINEKYQLVITLGKPIMIAEAGIDLPGELKAKSVRRMVEIMESFPKIRAIVYFNARNPVTPIMSERPQWTLRPADRAILSSALDSADWFTR